MFILRFRHELSIFPVVKHARESKRGREFTFFSSRISRTHKVKITEAWWTFNSNLLNQIIRSFFVLSFLYFFMLLVFLAERLSAFVSFMTACVVTNAKWNLWGRLWRQLKANLSWTEASSRFLLRRYLPPQSRQKSNFSMTFLRLQIALNTWKASLIDARWSEFLNKYQQKTDNLNWNLYDFDSITAETKIGHLRLRARFPQIATR